MTHSDFGLVAAVGRVLSSVAPIPKYPPNTNTNTNSDFLSYPDTNTNTNTNTNTDKLIR